MFKYSDSSKIRTLLKYTYFGIKIINGYTFFQK